MDNQNFLPYLNAVQCSESSLLLNTLLSAGYQRRTLISWFIRKCRAVYRYFYINLHDFIFSILLGRLTLNENLYVAVHRNNLFKVKKLLIQGASPNFIPKNNKILCVCYNQNDNRSCCYRESLAASISYNESMLYMAVSHNNIKLVEELTQYHNYGDEGQHTEVVSLCLAVKRGYNDIVEYLISYANINPNNCVSPCCKHCRTNSSHTQPFQFPLYHACREGNIKLVKYLIELKNCDINQLTATYETCLHAALLGAIENRFDSIIKNQQRYSVVKYLLEKDCNVNLGLNPLCISLFHDNMYDYTSLLLQYKCDVNRLGWNYREVELNHKQNSNLLYSLDHPLAVCLCRLFMIKNGTETADHLFHKKHALEFIKNDANIYAMLDYGLKYPLLLGIQTNDETIVGAILEHAKSYIRFDIAEPLIHACTKTYYDIVKLLIDFGFNPNVAMKNRNHSKSNKINFYKMTTDDLLTHLDHYQKISVRNLHLSSIENKYDYCLYNYGVEHEITPLLALSQLAKWIFHQEKYESTIKTIENLSSTINIDFSIRPNQLALYYALLNEHTPIVYYCLEHFCPIDLPYDSIDFQTSSTNTHFHYTLFHLISTCCRLTSHNKIKRILLDSYAKTMLKIRAYDMNTSMKNVLAYMKLWLADGDFVCDEILFEHLVSLPYIDNIIDVYNANSLRTLFGVYYQRIMGYRLRSKPMYSLKELCRMKFHQHSQLYCQRKQVNLLKIGRELNILCKSLQNYLFYTNINSKSLISRLLNSEKWNSIHWM